MGVSPGEEGLHKTPPGFIPWEIEIERDPYTERKRERGEGWDEHGEEEVNEGEGSHCSVWNVVWF